MSGYHWLHVSKGWSILLQWYDLTSSSDGSTSSGDGSTILSASNTVNNMIQNRISSETHGWYATWEIEPKNLGFTQMTSQGGVEGQNSLLIWAPMCFFVKPRMVSLSLYNGTNQWLLKPGWDGSTTFNRSHLKCMSGIGDHRFTFLMNLQSNYTFYTNLTIFSITRLLIEDVTRLILFNVWKVEKITQHSLMPV